MQQCDTLIDARWVIPVEPERIVHERSSLVINNGRIVALLPTVEARAAYSPGVHIERPNHVVFPGFVNTHCHAAMTLFRGYADDLRLEAWLREAIWPAEHRFASAEMVRDGTRHAIAEMLRAGVTCFSDQYFFPEMAAAAANELQVRAVIATPVLDFATPWAASAAECLSRGSELVHDAYVDHPLIQTCFAPHSTEVVSDKTFNELRIVADQLDVAVQIHLHETAAEVHNAVQKTGLRPLERLTELGLVNASLLAVHAVHLTDTEVDQLAAAGASVAHCPHSNLKLASGFARVGYMRDRGVNVALGTDGAASNNALDMLAEMRTAALVAKAVADDAEVLNAHEALRMATADGAAALGLGDETGSLTPGKAADIACVDVAELRSQPLHDPASQLVYASSAAQVSDVWVAGRHLLEARTLKVADEDEIMARSAEWQQQIVSASDL